jgi:hypothetical protein
VEALTPHAFAIGDTMPGVAESHNLQASSRNQGASMVRGVLVLGAVGCRQNAEYRAGLMDVSGRKVLVLRPGANDVSRLAPGVYFVREAQARAQAQPVRKVIVSR